MLPSNVSFSGDSDWGKVTTMVNTRPGYWDLDRCAWVVADPTVPAPPLRHAEHAHERDIAARAERPAVPEPRTEPAPSDHDLHRPA
jgi:hypothetical protein